MERQRRYPSDLTDEQWEIVEPMLPLIKSPGRIPKHPRRAIVDAILYVVRSGCSWRQLPVDFPPWQTVYWQFQQWEKRQVTVVGLSGALTVSALSGLLLHQLLPYRPAAGPRLAGTPTVATA
jgi:hypothetical protein